MSTPDPDATARVPSDAEQRPFVTPAAADGGQFAPGTIVAGRFRIASLLGSGGMGEVYRAEDTKLAQSVALKFLPARLARDPLLLARLHDEVRHGRQIAHPNVCRIYDIIDWDSTHFVAMEYVDGEDLARLLRRIGRLAHDKAVDIARGIAAGLLAAHAKGILHRDLKPANVMIDARGEARIMDFGLALAAGDDDGTISGTPAYMAPEQLDGQPATIQSDLYALGLVMYELFTGKRAHNARTLPERIRDLTSNITTPSDIVRDIDPAVERIILRCIHPDPLQRPRSAREVVEALPGGDPLAAALAAGETPSPRIVAAAGTEGSLSPAAAWTLLGACVVFVALIAAGKKEFGIGNYVAVEKPAAVQADRAATMLRGFGIPPQPHTEHELHVDGQYLAWILRTDSSAGRWQRLRKGPAVTAFAYREQQAPDVDRTAGDPLRPGASEIRLDASGRLVALRASPDASWPRQNVDWGRLLAPAGLDVQRLTPARPETVPSAAADARAAWTGTHPDDGTPIRVEAAMWQGTPVFFAISGEWEAASIGELPFSGTRIEGFVTFLFVTVVILGLLMAWRNVRLRRGDRQGALRVAAAVFLLDLAAGLLMAHHTSSPIAELQILRRAIGDSLLWSAVMFVLYLALEPVVRRRWPSLLISSTRLIGGGVRDPMVGRDILIGVAAGLAHTLLIIAAFFASARSGEATAPPFIGAITSLVDGRYAVADVVDSIVAGALQGFVFIAILVTFLLVLRRRWLAAAGLGAVMTVGFFFAIGDFVIGTAAITLLIVGVAARYGLLAICAAQASFLIVHHSPMFAGGSWDSIRILPAVVALAVAVWAFRVSLGGQSPFSARFIDS